MLVISQADTNKEWHELGGGVSMRFRPATSMDLSMATARARAVARQLAEDERLRASYALERFDMAPGPGDEDADAVMRGIGDTLTAVELAMIVGDGLSGVALDEDENPPFNRRTLMLLFRQFAPETPVSAAILGKSWSYAYAFYTKALARVSREQAEGKPLAAAPDSTGAAAQSSAGPVD